MLVHHRAVLRAFTLAIVIASPLHAKTGDLPESARRYLERHTRHDAVNVTRYEHQATEFLERVVVPGYARQTGLPCSACHYQFPQLNAFGRQFKLNGYTMTGLKPIEDKDTHGRSVLQLLPFNPISVMMQASLTHLATAIPGTQNTTVAMPQQLSVFWAGAISSKLGTFSQLTYTTSGGTIKIDNVDVRYADHGKIGTAPIVWGVTFNNNPTVEDLWNTTPAWSYPFQSSETAPSPLGGAQIEGGLAQRAVGVGAYAMANETFYAQIAAYRSSVPTGAVPLDTSARNIMSGATPYWRLALQHKFGKQYLMVGTFGLSTKLYPEGVSGPTNRYTDAAFDAQHETPLGPGNLVTRVAWIHESQTNNASYFAEEPTATNRTGTLQTLRASSSWYPSQTLGVTVSAFSTSGTADALLYAPEAVNGSASGRVNSNGGNIEVAFNPWENARMSIAYTMFNRFNGASKNYDGDGRNASSNNALFLAWWFNF